MHKKLEKINKDSPERGSERNLWRVFVSKKQVYTDSAPFLKGKHIYPKPILFLNVNHNLITNKDATVEF